MSASDVARHLGRRGVPFAVIGARAMAFHGIVRFTLDTDLLTTDRSVLDSAFWNDLAGASVDVRRGDLLDPLAGVVRIHFPTDQVDVVVGKFTWQKSAVTRARPLEGGDPNLPVVQRADLVVLKLYAGGPQDLWDIHALLASGSGLQSEVDLLVSDLPDDARQLWERVRSERDGLQ
jgi:hypothetical protein